MNNHERLAFQGELNASKVLLAQLQLEDLGLTRLVDACGVLLDDMRDLLGGLSHECYDAEGLRLRLKVHCDAVRFRVTTLCAKIKRVEETLRKP